MVTRRQPKSVPTTVIPAYSDCIKGVPYQLHPHIMEVWSGLTAAEVAPLFSAQRNRVEHELAALSGTIFPEWAESIDPAFWGTPLGELIAQCQWLLYGPQAVTIADAARRMFGTAGSQQIDKVKRVLATFRRPESQFKSHRKKTASGTAGVAADGTASIAASGTARAYYVRSDDVDAAIASGVH